MTNDRPRRTWRVLALTGLTALALTACSSSSDSASSNLAEANLVIAPESQAAAETAAAEQAYQDQEQADAPAAGYTAADEFAASGSGGEAAAAPGGSAPLDPTVVSADRDVIRTATVAVTVEVVTSGDDATDTAALRDGVTDAALKVRALVGTEGYVSASDSSGRVAVVTLRIPATGYQAAIEGLAAIGQVSSLQEQAQDVTAQVVDLESRVKTMTASVDRVRALLASATDLDDVVSLESELAQREADLESVQQQRAALAGQAALSTVTVTLTGVVTGTETAVVEEPVEESTGFLAGLGKGWDAFVAFGTGVLAVVGAVLPFLPVIAVVVLLGWLLFRTVSRRTLPGAPVVVGPVPQPTGTDEADVSR